MVVVQRSALVLQLNLFTDINIYIYIYMLYVGTGVLGGESRRTLDLVVLSQQQSCRSSVPLQSVYRSLR
jgi:hypothetical protein